jgi:hypothetical protein
MLDVLSASGGYVKADKKTAEKQTTLHFGQYSDNEIRVLAECWRMG